MFPREKKTISLMVLRNSHFWVQQYVWNILLINIQDMCFSQTNILDREGSCSWPCSPKCNQVKWSRIGLGGKKYKCTKCIENVLKSHNMCKCNTKHIEIYKCIKCIYTESKIKHCGRFITTGMRESLKEGVCVQNTNVGMTIMRSPTSF